MVGWYAEIGRVGKYGRSAVNWSSLVFHCHIILRRLVTPALESLPRVGCSLHSLILASKSISFCGLWNAEVLVHVQRPHEEEPKLRSSFILTRPSFIPLHFSI